LKTKNWVKENALNVGYVLLHALLWVVIVPGILAIFISPENRTSIQGVIGAFAVGPVLIYLILEMVHDWYFQLSTFWQVLIPSFFVFFFGFVFGQVHEAKERIRNAAFVTNYVRIQKAQEPDNVQESSEVNDGLDPVDFELDRKIDIEYLDLDELLELQKEYRFIISESERNLRSVNEEILNRQKQEKWYVTDIND
jgi:hypothetical protein